MAVYPCTAVYMRWVLVVENGSVLALAECRDGRDASRWYGQVQDEHSSVHQRPAARYWRSGRTMPSQRTAACRSTSLESVFVKINTKKTCVLCVHYAGPSAYSWNKKQYTFFDASLNISISHWEKYFYFSLRNRKYFYFSLRNRNIILTLLVHRGHSRLFYSKVE